MAGTFDAWQRQGSGSRPSGAAALIGPRPNRTWRGQRQRRSARRARSSDNLTYETEVQVKPPEATVRARRRVLANPWSNRPSPGSDTEKREFRKGVGSQRAVGLKQLLSKGSVLLQEALAALASCLPPGGAARRFNRCLAAETPDGPKPACRAVPVRDASPSAPAFACQRIGDLRSGNAASLLVRLVTIT
jgi:hypothetical protein